MNMHMVQRRDFMLPHPLLGLGHVPLDSQGARETAARGTRVVIVVCREEQQE
jgi:hypothetical protein